MQPASCYFSFSEGRCRRTVPLNISQICHLNLNKSDFWVFLIFGGHSQKPSTVPIPMALTRHGSVTKKLPKHINSSSGSFLGGPLLFTDSGIETTQQSSWNSDLAPSCQSDMHMILKLQICKFYQGNKNNIFQSHWIFFLSLTFLKSKSKTLHVQLLQIFAVTKRNTYILKNTLLKWMNEFLDILKCTTVIKLLVISM